MSNVLHDGKWKRPEWNHTNVQGSDQNSRHIFIMLESARNVLEQIRDELKGIRYCHQVGTMFRDLSAIRKNTTKRKYTKKAKAME